MKKMMNARLQLNRETLRQLDSGLLREIQGGSAWVSCPTNPYYLSTRPTGCYACVDQ
jgi:hypothetical protein